MNSTSASKSDANGAWVGGSFPVIAMAASAGGLKALSVILGGLPENFPAAIAIVMHLAPDHKSLLAEILDARSRLEVKQADTGDFLCPSCVFVAPPNRHLSVAPDGRLKLSSPSAQKVNHARPSAEPLFATVAEVYGKKAIAVVLTGGDGDGSFGVQVIKDEGGKVIAQDRPTSQDFSMPKTAIQTGDVDFVLPLDEIAAKLIELVAATVGAHSDAAQVARGQTPAPPAAGGEQRGEKGRRPAEAPLSSLVPRGQEEKPGRCPKATPAEDKKVVRRPPEAECSRTTGQSWLRLRSGRNPAHDGPGRTMRA